MANIAILVGNTDYLNLSRLECCRDDVRAIKELLEATEKYADVAIIENANADDLKARIRAAIDKGSSAGEIFFYYTGHGLVHQTEFFFCASNFDSARPNETGISMTDLHTFLKLGDPGLAVTVIDACNSGARLVKADGALMPRPKQEFRNLIQIASCLDTQTSLTGKPLSVFTEKFRAAALRKQEGVVYYLDIIDMLKDEFLQNDSQTPFFVSQYTGREQFVDDAHRLDGLRTKLRQSAVVADDQLPSVPPIAPAAPTNLLNLLQLAEARLVQPDSLQSFVSTFFDNLKAKLPAGEFSEYFEHEFTEHADFKEPTAYEFITRVMSREARQDNFVTASVSKKRRRNPWDMGGLLYSTYYGYNPDDYVDTFELDLNCEMPRAQLKLVLTPKFSNLQRAVLVATCAPSLEHCYIFEITTEHRLRDFKKFDAEGREVVQRWYKLRWDEQTDGVVARISTKFGEVVREQLEAATKRLGLVPSRAAE